MDYDGWAAEGLTDWGYAHCLPYFRKMETFTEGADDWRGGDGPLRITRAEARHKLYDAFLRGGEQAGYDVTPDHNGYKQEGLHVAQSFIDEGVRWSAPRAYLRPAGARPNLHIMRRSLVTRVVFEGGAAVGIEVSDGGVTQVIRCGRELVLCAGAMNTPRLLLLSGVGPADELRALGIDVVVDIPEVGRNLQNHPASTCSTPRATRTRSPPSSEQSGG
jgi:choline dehydrogenase